MALSDTTEALPEVGSDIGGFLTGLAPGVVEFVFTLGIAGGIVFIIYGVYSVIMNYVKGTGTPRR